MEWDMTFWKWINLYYQNGKGREGFVPALFSLFLLIFHQATLTKGLNWYQWYMYHYTQRGTAQLAKRKDWWTVKNLLEATSVVSLPIGSWICAPPSLTSRCICYYYIKYYIEADFQVRRPSRSLDIYVTTYHNFRKEKICTSFIGYAYICRLR